MKYGNEAEAIGSDEEKFEEIVDEREDEENPEDTLKRLIASAHELRKTEQYQLAIDAYQKVIAYKQDISEELDSSQDKDAKYLIPDSYYNIALCYQERTDGDRLSNLKSALDYFDTAHSYYCAMGDTEESDTIDDMMKKVRKEIKIIEKSSHRGTQDTQPPASKKRKISSKENSDLASEQQRPMVDDKLSSEVIEKIEATVKKAIGNKKAVKEIIILPYEALDSSIEAKLTNIKDYLLSYKFKNKIKQGNIFIQNGAVHVINNTACTLIKIYRNEQISDKNKQQSYEVSDGIPPNLKSGDDTNLTVTIPASNQQASSITDITGRSPINNMFFTRANTPARFFTSNSQNRRVVETDLPAATEQETKINQSTEKLEQQYNELLNQVTASTEACQQKFNEYSYLIEKINETTEKCSKKGFINLVPCPPQQLHVQIDYEELMARGTIEAYNKLAELTSIAKSYFDQIERFYMEQLINGVRYLKTVLQGEPPSSHSPATCRPSK